MDTPLQYRNIVTPTQFHTHGTRDLFRKRESALEPANEIPTNAPMRRLRYELQGMDAWQADVDFAAYVAGSMDDDELARYGSSLSPADLEEAHLLRLLHSGKDALSKPRPTAMVADTSEGPANLTEFRQRYLARAEENNWSSD